MAFHGLSSCVIDVYPANRDVSACRFWSQTKTGQDEEAMLKTVPGVLNPVVTVHMPDACVMLHHSKSGQVQHMIECAPTTDALLTSLQYGQAKEVCAVIASYACLRQIFYMKVFCTL